MWFWPFKFPLWINPGEPAGGAWEVHQGLHFSWHLQGKERAQNSFSLILSKKQGTTSEENACLSCSPGMKTWNVKSCEVNKPAGACGSISLGKAAKGAPAQGGGPSSPWLWAMGPTSRCVSPTLGSEIGCASKEKTKRWTRATSAWWWVEATGSQERTVGLSETLSLTAVWNERHTGQVRWPFCLCSLLNSRGWCQGRNAVHSLQRGGTPMFLTLPKSAA